MDNWTKPFPLVKLYEEFNIDPRLLIKAWVDGDICLYIKLDGEPCRISRSVTSINSAEGKRSFEETIDNGEDSYQNNRLPEFRIRQFYTNKVKSHYPKILMKHLAAKNVNMSNILIELENTYRKVGNRINYNGVAHGYWLIKPIDGCFHEKEYTLPDMIHILSLGASRTKSITIYDYTMSDYLMTSQDTLIDNPELFVKHEDIEKIMEVENVKGRIKPSLNKIDLSCSDKHEGEIKPEKCYPILKHRIALCIIIREWWAREDKDDKKIAHNAALHLRNFHKYSTEDGTVMGWITRPEETIHKPRICPIQIEALSIFLKMVCKDKNVKNSTSAIAKMLTELAHKDEYKFDISFSKEEVKAWLLNKKQSN
ncbi:TPA: hypothetical protein ACWPBI_001818 [Salmonella enterica]|uniref:Prophage protein n=6 Tax=Salmonella TaxID=590 RepID=A0A5Z3J4Z6_SALER|nr:MULTISPECIES: hypothetical protein [Salmonella]EAW1245682.1 hypothetical protein [Salmonella enterica subsp. enterica]EBV8558765.1 hypothetical protein [Salmonella enterica subsp. enterica serovar Enteritidis]ECE0763474.1 hypothetical protein [Salmonella enterica subsp. enterica serovar Duesseldorf]ECU7541654.1 hypothetical protein [Salmonella enterica subsp. enterica serovar Saintpaul]EDU2372460.1 hypothetical protein [Salmonella enterica subsp. enterica serovar Reading]